MKAFDEWKNEFCKTHKVSPAFAKVCKIGWKACLEWLDYNCFCCGDSNDKCPMCEFRDAVIKEMDINK